MSTVEKKVHGERDAIFWLRVLFGFFFLVSLLNLSFFIVFPVKALFFLFSFLVACGKISVERRPALAMVATQRLTKATGE